MVSQHPGLLRLERLLQVGLEGVVTYNWCCKLHDVSS
jgi:hypothetical protein